MTNDDNHPNKMITEFASTYVEKLSMKNWSESHVLSEKIGVIERLQCVFLRPDDDLFNSEKQIKYFK
jgi:hypothetical protein